MHPYRPVHYPPSSLAAQQWYSPSNQMQQQHHQMVGGGGGGPPGHYQVPMNMSMNNALESQENPVGHYPNQSMQVQEHPQSSNALDSTTYAMYKKQQGYSHMPGSGPDALSMQTPFVFFQKEMQLLLMREHPQWSLKLIGTVCGKLWTNLDPQEQEVYAEKARRLHDAVNSGVNSPAPDVSSKTQISVSPQQLLSAAQEYAIQIQHEESRGYDDGAVQNKQSDSDDDEVARMEKELADAENDLEEDDNQMDDDSQLGSSSGNDSATSDDESDGAHRSGESDGDVRGEEQSSIIPQQSPHLVSPNMANLNPWERLWKQGQNEPPTMPNFDDGGDDGDGDPNEPNGGPRGKRPKRKRWKSPYDFYLQEFKAKWRDRNSSENVKEVRRIAKETWDAQDEVSKARYQTLARQNRESCESGEAPSVAMEASPPGIPNLGTDPADPPPPPAEKSRSKRARRLKSSYDFFLSGFKKQYRKDNKNTTYDDKEARKAAREVWQNMSDAEREPYEQQAHQMRSEEMDAEGDMSDDGPKQPYDFFRAELLEKLGTDFVANKDPAELEDLIKLQWVKQTDSKIQEYEKKAQAAKLAKSEAQSKKRARPRPHDGINAGASNIGGMIYCYRQTGHLPQTSKLTYVMMVRIAIFLLNEPQGSSFPAVSRFIKSHYTVNDKTFRSCMLQALNKLKENNQVEKRKSSHKLTATEQEIIQKSVTRAEEPDEARISKTAAKKRRIEEAKLRLEEAKRNREAVKAQEEEKRRYPIDDIELMNEYAMAGRRQPTGKRPQAHDTVEWLGEFVMLCHFRHVVRRLPYDKDGVMSNPFEIEAVELSVHEWIAGMTGSSEAAVDLLDKMHVQLLSVLLSSRGYSEILNECTWSNILCKHVAEWINDCKYPLVGVFESLAAAQEKLEQGTPYGALCVSQKMALIRWLCDAIVGSDKAHDSIDGTIEQARLARGERVANEQEIRRKEREEKELLKKQRDCETGKLTRDQEERRQQQQELLEAQKKEAMIQSRLERAERGRMQGMQSTPLNEFKDEEINFQDDPDLKDTAAAAALDSSLIDDSDEPDEPEPEEVLGIEDVAVLVTRIDPIGRDRDLNKYWYFKREAPNTLFVESKDGQTWGYFKYQYEIDRLLKSLDIKGIREKALMIAIRAVYEKLTAEMPKVEDPEAPEEIPEADEADEGPKKEEPVEPVETAWVQCEMCHKWRKVAPHIDSTKLSDRWICHNNTWDIDHASCMDPEENEEVEEELVRIIDPNATNPSLATAATGELPGAAPSASIATQGQALGGESKAPIATQPEQGIAEVAIKHKDAIQDKEDIVMPEAAADGEAAVKQEAAADGEAAVKQEAPADGEAAVKQEAAANGEVAVKQEAAADGEAAVKQEAAADGEVAVKQEAAADEEAAVKQEAAADGEAAVKQEAMKDKIAKAPNEPETLGALLLTVDMTTPVEYNELPKLRQLRNMLVCLYDKVGRTVIRIPHTWYEEAVNCEDEEQAANLLASLETAVIACSDGMDPANAIEYDLEVLGITDVVDQTNSRREKKLLWQNASERDSWLKYLTQKSGISHIALVGHVLSRRLTAFIEKLQAADMKRTNRVADKGTRGTKRPYENQSAVKGVSARDKRRRDREQMHVPNMNAPLQPSPLRFKRNKNIVWGKVKGMDWWPAEVCTVQGGIKCKDGDQMIVFFCTDEYCFVQSDDIIPFDPAYDAVEKMLPAKDQESYDTLIRAVHKATERAITLSDTHTGEFLWAKLKGHPWWPCEVVAPTYAMPASQGQKLVIFFETREFAFVPIDNVKPFVLDDPDMSGKATKNKQLQAAVQLVTQAAKVKAIASRSLIKI